MRRECQAKQCALINWVGAEARKLSWSSLMTMEPLALSFLLRSTYNLLPTPANHKQWGFTGDDTCAMCKFARGTLRHVLSSCGSARQMYTWRHSRALAILAELTETQCRVANEQPTWDPNPCISFLKEGEAPPRQVSKPQGKSSSQPHRISSLPESHRAYPWITRHCDIVRHSQARHRCGADCTLGGEHGRSLREEETSVRESTHGLWRQRMHLSSDAHGGWLSWLHRLNNNLIPEQASTNEQGQAEGPSPVPPFPTTSIPIPSSAYRVSHSSGNGMQLDLVHSQKEHHSMTKSPSCLSPSLPTTHPQTTTHHPPIPHPSPVPPFPTTSIPIPSSAYRVSRSSCSPEWHRPVAEASGSARVWGTTSSRRNHLTHSGWWLTRVMSRQPTAAASTRRYQLNVKVMGLNNPGPVALICVSKQYYLWFRLWLVACSARSHYLNQWWLIVNFTPGPKLVKSESKHNNFHTRKWVSKCCL